MDESLCHNMFYGEDTIANITENIRKYLMYLFYKKRDYSLYSQVGPHVNVRSTDTL